MHTLDAMLDKIKETRSIASDNGLAKHLGVSRQRVSSWRNGERLPDEVSCARIADEANVPLARVLGLIGEARAISREAKEVWRRLATAACLTLTAIGALAHPAEVSARVATAGSDAICILRQILAWLGSLVSRAGYGNPSGGSTSRSTCPGTLRMIPRRSIAHSIRAATP